METKTKTTFKTYEADFPRVREIFERAAGDARDDKHVDPIWIEGFDRLVAILDDVAALGEYCVARQTIVLAFNRFVELHDGIASYIAQTDGGRRVDMVLNILIDAQHKYLNELARTFGDFLGRPLNAIESGALRAVMLGRATQARI